MFFQLYGNCGVSVYENCKPGTRLKGFFPFPNFSKFPCLSNLSHNEVQRKCKMFCMCLMVSHNILWCLQIPLTSVYLLLIHNTKPSWIVLTNCHNKIKQEDILHCSAFLAIAFSYFLNKSNAFLGTYNKSKGYILLCSDS